MPIPPLRLHLSDLFAQPMNECTKIEYPKPDGVLSFDLLTNLARSGTAHEADQPAHLKLREWSKTTDVNLPVYDGPEGRWVVLGRQA
jgi:electron-transferring-flavoprotein dehydrogenase